MQKAVSAQTWPGFIESLERYVNWDDAQSMPSQFSVVEQLLREIAQYPEQLAKRTDAIVADDALFDAYEPHTDYPRLFMDKFMLYMDPSDRFRVRLHRFKTQAQNGTLVERVHSHKWHASTIIMRGQYVEKRFAVHDLNDKEMKAKVTQASQLVLREGETNSLLMGVPHQIVNLGDAPCITLFVRGRSFYDAARIFYPERDEFVYTYGPQEQKKLGYRHIGRLDGHFLE